MRIAIAQINPTVGDLAGNRALVEASADKAASAGADVVVLPEMVLTGYPPMDLLAREDFVRDQLRELTALQHLSASYIGNKIQTAIYCYSTAENINGITKK